MNEIKESINSLAEVENELQTKAEYNKPSDETMQKILLKNLENFTIKEVKKIKTLLIDIAEEIGEEYPVENIVRVFNIVLPLFSGANRRSRW